MNEIQIQIQYNAKTGELKYGSNLEDAVALTGILEMVKHMLLSNKLSPKPSSGIVVPGKPHLTI